MQKDGFCYRESFASLKSNWAKPPPKYNQKSYSQWRIKDANTRCIIKT